MDGNKPKFCPECGHQLQDQSFKFCPECGFSLTGGKNAVAVPNSDENDTRYGNTTGETGQDYDGYIPAYIRDALIYGEKVVFICHIHWKIWIPTVFLGIITLVLLYITAKTEPGYVPFVMPIPLILFIIALCKALIESFCTCLAITNKRVICKFGFIWRKTFEMNIDMVESVQLDQTVWGRIFDCSTVTVNGAGQMNAPVPNIINAKDFKQCLLSEREKARATRR